ncbi:MAG: flagellar biosynthetic protein FliO [Actinomycetota bacterium]|nr:flagellar biosynthetic protein FliO [Actinomycetota bacterium]
MSNTSTVELFVRLALSLAVVLGLMWFMARVMQKKGFAPGARRASTRGADVELLSRKPLGKHASIAVIRAGGRAMVVGITEHSVTKLDDADIEEIDLEEVEGKKADGQWTANAKGPRSSSPTWKAMLEQVRERTVRR